MNYTQIIKPSKLNLNKSPKSLSDDESFFLLNHEVNNPSSLDKGVPLAANYLACDLELGAGENYNIGRYYSSITNETYCWTYNSNGVNFIWRINGKGECQIVYNGECLIVNPDPKNEITQFRAYLKVDKVCRNQGGKQLIWVDGSDTPIGQLDVEASIATNFFTTPFFDICPDDCAALQMCVPEPPSCPIGEFVPYSSSDAGLSNYILDKGIKVMYKHVYYDGRASEWSDRSTLYFQNAKGCFDNSEGLPRCLKFRIPVGNPLVDKIEFAASEDGGLTWYLRDTIEKYKKYNSNQEFWYERDLSEFVSSTYSEDDCSFDYLFCNDTQRLSISPTQVSREFNPMPRSPQGFIRIKDELGFFNYIKGNCPIDKIEVDKFDIQLNCTDITSCNTEYAKVTVRAIVYNETLNHNGFIFRQGGNYGDADDVTDAAWFNYGFTGYGQTFTEKTRDFILYIEATNYWGAMEQWRSTSNFSTKKKVGVIAGLDSLLTRSKIQLDILNGNFYYQEYIFTVPKGTKGFLRLVSHNQNNGTGNNQDTSTQVIGILPDIRTYTGTTTISGLDQNIKEIYIDTCTGDVELFQAFVISDFYHTTGAAYSGYITDKFGLPVEGARIYADAFYVTTTDFNGFYSFYRDSLSITINIYVEQGCVGNFTNLEHFSATSETGQAVSINYQIQSESYRDGFYATVEVPVNTCESIGVAGIRVAMSGNKYKVADANGVAHFKLRNYNSRNRSVLGVVMDIGNCLNTDCANNCNPCLPQTVNTILDPCFVTKPDYTLTLTSQLNLINSLASKYGTKAGGRYAYAIVGEGNCGRITSAYEIKYIDIPKTQTKGNLGFCSFTFTATGMNLPTWVTKLKIVRSVNLNPFDLQWVVDDITRTSDGKIILTIQSLNDYNKQFNFKTNTVYKYLPGDRVEFIKNGDGKIFDTLTYGILNYLTLSPFNDEVISGVTNDANYFNQLIISDDGKLDGLTKGAVIELQTPTSVPLEPTYFEICANISVSNGRLDVESGTFNTFDTYLVNRQIGAFPAQYFESKTPSDFWGGTNIDDTGKPHFVNKYEDEKRYGRNITLNSPNQFNYFGDLEKTFGGGQDDIIAIVIKDDKIGAGISQNNNFLFQVSDGLLRLDSGGVIHAVSADSLISNPQAKVRGEYGCQYDDIGSIFFGDGYFKYVDSKNNADIIHNYQYAKEAGESQDSKGNIENSCSSYFRKRTVEKDNFNKTAKSILDHYRFSVGINKSTGVLYQTLKSLRQSGISNAKDVYEFTNDTIMYNPNNDSYLGFAAFTPEGYSELNLNNDTGCAMITFQNGLAYIHPVIADKWNEFYGITTDWVIGATLNKFTDKIKVAISFELQSSSMFYVNKVLTDKNNFISEVPPVRVTKNQDNKWNASFLNNVNSRGGLFNGENTRGYYAKIYFIRDNTLGLGYGTIDNNKRVAYSEIDDILLKFSISEQSGYTENL